MKIHWEEEKCCHSGICVQNLPEVFRVEDGRFTINPGAAEPERIREVIAQCPSGALSIEE